MKLTQSDSEKVRSWIAQRCGHMRCFCCGSGRWTLAELTSIQVGFDVHTTRFHYHEGLPVVSVVCENCGHVVHFSTNVMGFQPDAPAIEEVPAATPEASSMVKSSLGG